MNTELVRRWEEGKPAIRAVFEAAHPDNYADVVRAVVSVIGGQEYSDSMPPHDEARYRRYADRKRMERTTFRKGPGINRPDDDALMSLYASHTAPQLAEKLGVPYWTVRYWIAKAQQRVKADRAIRSRFNVMRVAREVRSAVQ